MRRALPFLACLLLLVTQVSILYLKRKEPSSIEEASQLPFTDPIPSGPSGKLSTLGAPPEWNDLSPFQSKHAAESFKISLESIYALPLSWQNTITLVSEKALVSEHLSQNSEQFILKFGPNSPPVPTLPDLDKIHIAIDPGHIGGEFAQMEERNFQPFPDDPQQRPVREGELTLLTAQHLKPLLENMGAKVTLVREDLNPVTKKTPKDFLPDFPKRKQAEKVFYRTAEIHARAKLINNTIKPDLVLCIHYNADGWTDPLNPWAKKNHFHLILHGAYMRNELALDDQRFEMLNHLLNQRTEQVLPLAQTVSDVFLRELDLVPYHYQSTSPALPLDEERPIFARNLLANRLYQAPTLFLEPYVMNTRSFYERVQLGDYDGLREVDGKMRPSVVREYAQTLALGIQEYYENQN